jgi:hypothetical protein
VASLFGIRNRAIVWTHFYRATGWQETKVGRFVRWLISVLPIITWHTTSASEIAAEHRKYGWNVEVLPEPLTSYLDTAGSNYKLVRELEVSGEKSDRLICWTLLTRPEQGLDLLQKMMDHESASSFPKKFIKCFVSERANVQENDNIELIRLPYGSKDYHLRFNECDVVLLPYDAHSYRGARSGIFTEAVATGKIPVVSDGTTMARELREFKLGDLVLDFANSFSWTVINELRENTVIRERVNLMAEHYSKEHDVFAFAAALYRKLKQIDPRIPLAEPKRSDGNYATGVAGQRQR